MKVGSKHALINRTHAFSGQGRRRQRAADGRLPRTRRSIAARHATVKFSDTGLNAASKYRGEFSPTAAVARSIDPRHTNTGHRRCQATSSTDRERQLQNAEGGHRDARDTSRDAGVAEHGDLIDVSREELGYDALIGEDGSERDTRDEVDERLPHGLCGVHTLLEPQAQAIEAPRGRPADERTEDQRSKSAPTGPKRVR